MPQFLDMAKPPAYLLKNSAVDNTPPTPTGVTTAPTGKKYHPPSKKVNFGALCLTQDSADQSPMTSSSASTITVTDDWGA